MLGWLGLGIARGEVNIPLTGLFFQMIESNDISGEKIRMKETVEGEWLLDRRGTGLWERAGWFCLQAGFHLVLHHLPCGVRYLLRGQATHPLGEEGCSSVY